MKRIDIYYGGENYSVGNRDIADLKAEIASGIDSGITFWLEVNAGDGNPRRASLAVGPGTPIALLETPDSEYD